MDKDFILPQEHIGNVCFPDWIDPKDIYPRAQVGQPAPYFEGPAYQELDFQVLKSSDLAGQYFVLFFYPLDFTFVCPTEIISFAEAAPQFKEIGCQVIGASVDSQFSHFEYCQKPAKKGGLGDLKIPLIADITKTIARIYGALITRGPNAGVACRATFIVDGKGILRHASYNDLPVGRNVEEVLRLVQAFQYVDTHGEVCPSKWKPGAKTMKADHKPGANDKYWSDEHAKHADNIKQ